MWQDGSILRLLIVLERRVKCLLIFGEAIEQLKARSNAAIVARTLMECGCRDSAKSRTKEKFAPNEPESKIFQE